ncbi:MAG: hypothetical protein LRY52_01120 [Sulfurospirillum cavolei]|nr:hypothetical protein [Sulfurospirillum cavolei]
MTTRKIFTLITTLFLSISVHAASKKEIEIPRTVQKDIYKYYVLEENKKATIFQVTYKRVGTNSFDYGKVEINCPSKVIRLLGKSVKSVQDISTSTPGQWVKPAISTIESDMITYVCR